MQARAILEAAASVKKKGVDVRPEIMIRSRSRSRSSKRRVRSLPTWRRRLASDVPYTFGTMIELPRAALRAGELAEEAEFFSFGDERFSRKRRSAFHATTPGKFLPAYVDAGILPKDPFVSIDVPGVGELVRMGDGTRQKDEGKS